MFFTFFQSHKVINPQLYHGRHKREIASTHSSEEEGRHIHHLTVAWNIDGQDYVLDLKLNRDLIPEHYFEKYHHQVGKFSIKCKKFFCNPGICCKALVIFGWFFTLAEIKGCEWYIIFPCWKAFYSMIWSIKNEAIIKVSLKSIIAFCPLVK